MRPLLIFMCNEDRGGNDAEFLAKQASHHLAY